MVILFLIRSEISKASRNHCYASFATNNEVFRKLDKRTRPTGSFKTVMSP